MSRRGRYATALTLGGLLLTGCSSGAARGPVAAPATPQLSARPTSTTPTSTPPPRPATTSPTPRPSPTDARAAPAVPEPAVSPPPSTSGPLGPRNLPTPAVLGRGFRTYDDPGGAEDGFIGNGTWARARNAHQAAFEAQPIGCAHALPDVAMPIPRYALQGAYRNPRGQPATVLVFRFASPAAARTYYTGYNARLAACGTSPTASLAVVRLWTGPAARAVVRTYAGAETFVEVAVLAGSSIGLLATSSTHPAAEVAWSHGVAPRFAAVVDLR